ncbi:MAG: hypothetical protein ACUVTX_01255 [Bacteroidales bacterium]
MKKKLRIACIIWMFIFLSFITSALLKAQQINKFIFSGVVSEHRLNLKELKPPLPADWREYTHLVIEMRTSSPQRFSIWIYQPDTTPARLMIQPFGQNVWLRASIPIGYFKGKDQSGTDLASANNRRTNSFWMSVWGPYTIPRAVESIGFEMTYPVNQPTLEIRSVWLSKQDEGSEFLEKQPVTDEFGQWVYCDWPGKIKSKEQLEKELAEEEKLFRRFEDYGYCEYGGYKNTRVGATGFFRVEQIDGKWWFIDPHGHLFLSIGSNGAGVGFSQKLVESNPAHVLISKRLESWGMTSGGTGKPYTVMMRWPRTQGANYLGLPDVYSEEFARNVEQTAEKQCLPLKDDPLLIGYFVGNEPAWEGRESEVVDMILAGPDNATKTRLKEFLAGGDTPGRRKAFVLGAFEKYLDLICSSIRKFDPNHLNLGIRFGGSPSVDILRTAHFFDVCSINVYEYEPVAQLNRVYRYTGKPVLIGEFHIGVPANGLGAGLVQAMNQIERGIAYRYYLEQAAALDCFVGAYWFQWRDEPILGRMDGENYNIGFVDVTDRPYKELVEAAKTTHKRLYEVHSGKILPFNQMPKASEAGSPLSPWNF